MNPFLLYLLLLKATVTSFSGLASLPMIHNDLVVQRKLLTERQLNTAVAVGRLSPGPIGLWVVGAGYYAGGVPGACAGWLAVVTPAFLVIPLLRYLGRRAENPRLRGLTQAVTVAAAGLILAASVPLARDALTGALTAGIAAVSCVLLLATRIDTLWVLLAAALTGIVAVTI